ncbi:MAG TPA: Fur family transcriptional regulator [Candidatus Saccharimonadales bacterium]|nr:Fur family transcriptional regulator [Candidatus Saccharimonadales bacterium]
MRTSDALGTALDRAGYAVTAPRRAVADLVEQRDGHFTALDLVTEARRRRLGVGRATVFRAIELFEELGLVERLDLPTGEHAYVVCEPVHHHHVVCQRCGRDAEIEDCGIDALAASIESNTGYLVGLHRIELFGLCPACLSQGGASRRPTSRSSD